MIYFKGEENRSTYEEFSGLQKFLIPNTGYNLSAYLRFIVEFYDSLPDIVVFCKNSTYPRHVSEECFARLCVRDVYTPIVDPGGWQGVKFPVATVSSASDFLEINDSWYARKKQGRYFDDFPSFFRFVFPEAPMPTFLRFGPGANVVVPRAHILLRSRAFYHNLRQLIDYEPLAVESFFLERALDAIFCGPFEENRELGAKLDEEELLALVRRCGHRSRPPTRTQRAVMRLGYAAVRSIYSLTRRIP